MEQRVRIGAGNRSDRLSARHRLRWTLADEPSAQQALFPGGVRHEVGTGEFRGLEFLEVEAKTIINALPAAAALPFRHTINVYRGCTHACSYCFARPTHEYLDLDAGRDFETKLVVKVNAVERLRAELHPKRWAGDPIAMGTNTDPYQRCEGKYRLTQGVVTTLAEFANPFSILTKSTLVLRDAALLAEASRRTDVTVNFSIGTLDEDVWRLTEPGTPHPRKRVEALARLRDAGIRAGVLVAPILPGISDRDDQIEAVVRACVEAGAASITPITLHLRRGVREHYLRWLALERPDLLEWHEQLYRRSANAPKAIRERVARRVASVVEACGGLADLPSAVRSDVVATPSAPIGAGADARQLELLR